MYRTLSDLRKRVDDLIASYGEDVGVAAFIFSPADVFVLDEDYDENYLPEDEADKVLYEVGNTDYIYEQIGGVIDDEIKRVTLARVTTTA